MAVISRNEAIYALFVKLAAAFCLISFGALELVEETKYELAIRVVWQISLAILSVSLIYLFNSLIGTFGILRNDGTIIIFYSMMNIVIGLGLLSLGATGIYLRQTKDYNEIKDVLEDKFTNYYQGPHHRDNVNEIQSNFKCCGVENYKFWLGKDGSDVTVGCCIHPEVADCYKNIGLLADDVQDYIYTEGCFTKVSNYFKYLTFIFACVTCGVAFIPLFGAVMAGWLIPNRHNPEYKVSWP